MVKLPTNTNHNWLEAYELWLSSSEVDEETKTELKALQGQEVEIRSRFDGDLDFGTGGLRGIIGAGTRRMNRYVVGRATQGFADYLLNRYQDVEEKKAAIAFDSRRCSREFAEEAALVLAANGIKALLFSEMRPLPLLSFTVREMKCLAGIVITASHNPPQYNGYKIYGMDGGQAVPSLADPVTAAIAKVDIFRDVRRLSRDEAIQKGLLQYLGDEIDRLYLDRVSSFSFRPGDDQIRVVYTPLHGSGIHLVPRLLREQGYTAVFIQEEQAVADPDFSTVTVPNPEDPSAYLLAIKLAEAKGADLILATDPDADRVGCAVRDSQGNFVLLNGNQMGALLTYYLLSELHERDRLPSNGVIIKTIVTGNLGQKIAASFGIPTKETLTGFKYIGEKIREFEESGEHSFLFGYEESYGYLAGTHARDKDAVLASLLIVEMASHFKRQDLTLLQVLEALLEKHGYFLEELESIDLDNMALSEQIMTELENQAYAQIGGLRVVEKLDYTRGFCTNLLTGEQRAIHLPRSAVLCYRLEDESWFCVRPSGTEPKIKFYFSVTAGTPGQAREKMDAVKTLVLGPLERGA